MHLFPVTKMDRNHMKDFTSMGFRVEIMINLQLNAGTKMDKGIIGHTALMEQNTRGSDGHM